jgi:hypothetical protein
MRVRMKVYVSGTRDGEAWPEPGGEIDLPDEEAIAYLSAGMAEAVPVAAAVESASVDTRPRRRTTTTA